MGEVPGVLPVMYPSVLVAAGIRANGQWVDVPISRFALLKKQFYLGMTGFF